MAASLSYNIFASKFEVSTERGQVFMTPAEAEATFRNVPDVLTLFHEAKANPASAITVPSTSFARGIRPRNFGRYGVAQ
jgi:hypothetical protein